MDTNSITVHKVDIPLMFVECSMSFNLQLVQLVSEVSEFSVFLGCAVLADATRTRVDLGWAWQFFLLTQ